MASDILDDLFYGRLAPWEKIPKDDPILSDLIHRQSELSVQVEGSIGVEQGVFCKGRFYPFAKYT